MERDEWGFPEMEEVLTPPAGYVVSFAHFHEKGAAPRGLVPQLAPKKALRVLSASVGRTAAPPAASGRVTGETAGPTAEAALAVATGEVVPPPGTGQGVDPAPPSASSADPAVQSIAPGGPQAGEVIDLDADEAEETTAVEMGAVAPAAVTGTAAATEEGEFALTATVGTETAGEAGTLAPVAASKEAAVTGAGTSAWGAATEVAAAAEAGVPAPAPASEAVAPMGGSGRALASAVPAAALTSGMVVSILMAASGSAPALASTTPVPKVWSGSVLRWSSHDGPQPLFTLDDATEWGKW
nr:skin secretory protein xP2-like [Setaria viridis]